MGRDRERETPRKRFRGVLGAGSTREEGREAGEGRGREAGGGGGEGGREGRRRQGRGREGGRGGGGEGGSAGRPETAAGGGRGRQTGRGGESGNTASKPLLGLTGTPHSHCAKHIQTRELFISFTNDTTEEYTSRGQRENAVIKEEDKLNDNTFSELLVVEQLVARDWSTQGRWPPGSFVHRIIQARMLESVPISIPERAATNVYI